MSLRLLEERLAALEASGLRRSLSLPKGAISLCSNDYLGLAGDPAHAAAVVAAASGRSSGAGASRLVSGNFPAHMSLEERLAAWMGHESALLFSSGYAANTGLLGALLTEGDAVFSDALNHASIIDGIRLGRAARHIYPHRDLAVLEQLLASHRGSGLAVIVTESVFSMDGDIAPLAGLVALAKRFDAFLVVDEAHALGLYGAAGAGVLSSLGLSSDAGAVVGTFGKSFGASGAFVAGSSPLCELLVNRARSFVFSTAPSPLSLAAMEVALAEVEAGRRRAAAWHAASRMAAALEARGWWRGPARSLVFPVMVGAPERAVALRDALDARGFFVQAIRPPTVPVDTSRLRVTVGAASRDAELEAFAEALDGAAQSLGIERSVGSHVG